MMTDGLPKRYRWAYTNRFTETAGGGGTDTVKISPAANSIMRLISMRVQMCNAAAGRVTNVSTRDEDDAVRAVWGNVTLDDQGVNFPSFGSVAGADNVIDTQGTEISGDGSYLRVAAAALAQNEYFDIVSEFELIGTATRPTVTHTSTGTASTGTATQDEITVVRS